MELEGFSKRFGAMRPSLLRVASRLLGDAEMAEDAVQETLVKLWKMREKLDQHPNVEALAHTVLHNTAIDSLRRAKEKETIPIEELRRQPGAEAPPIDTELIGLIIDRLPPAQARAFRLKELEGYEADEICQIIGCSEQNLRQLLSRARRTIRQRYIALHKPTR